MIMKKITYTLSVALVATLFVVLASSCNKNVPEAVPKSFYLQSGNTIGDILNNDANYSILKAAVTKAGLMADLSDRNKVFTVFAPNDAAFTLSGIPAAAISVLPASTLASILQYHIIPGKKLVASEISTTFPNAEFASAFILPAPNTNPLVRFTMYPSRNANGAFVNNVPITATDIDAANGVIHRLYVVNPPPSKFLWDSISTSSDLTYLKAAIIRADSGVATPSKLQTALSSFGANLTVLAPTNLAFQTLLTGAIYKALMAQGMPDATALGTARFLASTPDVFSNPALYGALSAQTVKGIVVYHILGTTVPGIRTFSVNLPTTATAIKTLLNSAVSIHPGVVAKATFVGPVVGAATFKGLANATASNVIINPLNPFATDQNYINGVIMKIDQVLLPQ
jgi:uncharacterized surface protein with fasciclin (FAS1) repeats